ncbi:hypothetical protein AL475_11055 [Vibrio fluvialis]|uniref:hypothetical protein n=1 Tax=Vibrio fluvialis TaxID=676 RepID=UPI000CEB3D63|nr:hypothetical protein [Vibrio fluvialis]AVH32358.1 hypothetical protein AL475_11055 [Vibrio fluvialis]
MIWVLLAAFISSMGVVFSYYYHFHLTLHYPISQKPEEWAQFASFIGGLLGPILTFFSLIFLVHSLNLQRKANIDLSNQIARNEKNEKLKSFETHLFNMINAQSTQLELFSLEIYKLGTPYQYQGAKAIIELENEIEAISEVQVTDVFISEYLEEVDSLDKIYSSIRAFSLMIKLICDKLSDENGFTLMDRREYYSTVLSYTDFALIRLILMSIQFLDCHPSASLKGNDEFKEQALELGLSFELYNR